MKKHNKLAALLLSSIIAVSMTACFDSNSSQESSDQYSSSSAKKTQTITIYNGSTPTEYTVTLGETATIDVFTKPKYYFKGAYDSVEGGTKYFNSDGASTMIWGAGNPDTYYTQFGSIYDLTYSANQLDETPYRWNGTATKYVEFELDEQFKKAITQNLDENLKIDVSFQLSCDKNWDFQQAWLTNMTQGGEKTVLLKNTTLVGEQYSSTSTSNILSARLFQSGKIYVGFHALDSNLMNLAYYYVKNIIVSVSFANAE